MHLGQLLGNGMLWAVLLLCQPLDSPNLGEKLADLLLDILAVLLGHGFWNCLPTQSFFMRSVVGPAALDIK